MLLATNTKQKITCRLFFVAVPLLLGLFSSYTFRLHQFQIRSLHALAQKHHIVGFCYAWELFCFQLEELKHYFLLYSLPLCIRVIPFPWDFLAFPIHFPITTIPKFRFNTLLLDSLQKNLHSAPYLFFLVHPHPTVVFSFFFTSTDFLFALLLLSDFLSDASVWRKRQCIGQKDTMNVLWVLLVFARGKMSHSHQMHNMKNGQIPNGNLPPT